MQRRSKNQPFFQKGKQEEQPSSFSEEELTIQAVKKISPAVVSIVISKQLAQIRNLTGPNVFPFDDFFDFDFPFLKIQPSQPQPKNERPPKIEKQKVGGGTGFIISSDGLILTNKHVIADPEAEYTVITSDNKQYQAKILALDPFVDIGVLKIEAKDLPVATLGDSDKIQIGQTVIAIGNTLSEYRNTVTKGVISGINRRVIAGGGSIGSEVIEEAIQTDAAINPGNSGGPLVDLSGRVVGINTAISREGQLVGFAIPINVAKPIIESVKKYGRIIRPWLGVRYILINREIAEENSLPVDYGALIVRGEKKTELAVIPGSPADKAGLEENDIILEVDGIKVDEDNPLAQLIQKHKPGDKIKLKVLHKGKEKIMEVELGELK
jgi:serine protease Do